MEAVPGGQPEPLYDNDLTKTWSGGGKLCPRTIERSEVNPIKFIGKNFKLPNDKSRRSPQLERQVLKT